MTLREAMLFARRRLEAGGIEDAGLEADLLLRHALRAVGPQHAGDLRLSRDHEISRAYLFAHLDNALEDASASAYDAFVARRLNHEPSAYITGLREFYGLDFVVTPATLIPRPETELIVEAAIAFVHDRAAMTPTIADIGTGSGAIAVSLACSLPEASVFATDVSSEALAVARTNAWRHGMEHRITFRRGDLLEPVATYVDVIAANLPYVNTADFALLAPEVREYEPALALAAGDDGLELIRRLLKQAPRYLKPDGIVLLEFGYGQSEALEELARTAFPAASVTVTNDLAGIPRVLAIQT